MKLARVLMSLQEVSMCKGCCNLSSYVLRNEEGRWEILAGQRRFLAHKYLKKNAISAAILDERVDELQAKTISITENLMRRKLSGKELKDGILYLYKIYGTIKDVVIATGLPQNQVLRLY